MNKKTLLLLLIMTVLSVVFDQVTKVAAEKNLKTWSHDTDIDLYKGMRYPLGAIGDPFGDTSYISINFNYVRNQGAAWGSLAHMRDSIRIPFFVGMTIVASGVLLVLYRYTPAHKKLARLALALVFSGAIGNFIDRIRLGYVIDWIDVHWRFSGWQYYFPNFNFADIVMTIGVLILAVDTVLTDIKRHKGTKSHVANVA